MRRFTRFYHGKRLSGVRCAYCDMPRDGICLSQDYNWRKQLDCGHEVGHSRKLPLSELIRLGYVNYDYERNPLALAAINLEIRDGLRIIKERKQRRWFEQALPMQRKYL